MAEVTVSQLAEVVGAPVDRLLKQMKEAGLTQHSADEFVSDGEKQQLLAFLQKIHGEQQSGEKKKITLKRKTLSTLKGSSSGRKTVNVEVRKKRVYVKRDEEQEEPIASVADDVIEPVARVIDDPEEKRLVAEEARRAKIEEEGRKVEGELLDKGDEAQTAGLTDDKVEKKKRTAKSAGVRAVADTAAVEAAEVAAEKGGKKNQKNKHHTDENGEDKPKTKRGGAKDKLARGKSRSVRPADVYKLEQDSFQGDTSRPKRRAAKGKAKLGGRFKKQSFKMPTEVRVYDVKITELISVADLAQQMNVKAKVVIKSLMAMGVMANINESIERDTAVLVVEELGHRVALVNDNAIEDELKSLFEDLESNEEARAPVVTVMGHVDHGKTSLLDYIRKSQVADGEAGGITQHIGAYHVETDHGMISFLDTPGHAAFTAMRARGAKSTDVVILVVAADDGVMPQTEEAILHARAAGVPLVVAINKIDKEGADPDRVKNELAAKDVIPEDWGGDTQFIHVSAHTGDGIPELLDALLLQAEMLELSAPRDCPAQGLVIESFLDKGRGPVASVLVQKGILKPGEIVLAGSFYGRVKAMLDENGQPIEEAGPSIPIEILGLNGIPDAGDEFVVVPDEKKAREVSAFRSDKSRSSRFAGQQKAMLDNVFENLGKDEKGILNVVVKADVRGSIEAITSALADIGNEEVEVNVIYSGVGGITETDVNLALTSGAVMFGFNVRADNTARKLIAEEKIDLRYYSVIYNLLDDVKQALSGMLAPELREEIVGIAEVRDVFTSPKFGLIAGCMVIDGAVLRNNPIRVLRDSIVIYEGELESLRRFKDDANEVKKGIECGIGVKNYTDVKAGDQIEVFEVREIERSL